MGLRGGSVQGLRMKFEVSSFSMYGSRACKSWAMNSIFKPPGRKPGLKSQTSLKPGTLSEISRP